MMKISTRGILFFAGTLLALFLSPVRGGAAEPPPGPAADEEGCLICHKYSGLARIDQKTSKVRLFYIPGEKYKGSVHGKVLCRNCHLNLDVIPHIDAKRVDCSTKCHLKEPSTEVDFSHANLFDEVNKSIHGKGTEEEEKKYPQDMPGCTDCHINTVYQPVQGMDQMPGISRDALRRCIGCHTKEEWANRYYQHFTHRLHRSRTALETVNLCLNCHQDEQMMARHGLPATSNYRDTYHWKGVLYGDANAPDCISCHAPVGYSVHSLATMQSNDSPVHAQNLQQTCANEMGTQKCHPSATERFARGKIHRTGLGFDETVAAVIRGDTTLEAIEVLRKERRFQNLMDIDEEELAAMGEKERFQHQIYIIVKLVYTLLITVVIGGMLVHQLMDLYRTVKNRQNH
ncbi:MAG: hypothetical protein RBR09_01685 [Desulfobulbaceae bacterium]|jgi:hypothetical protein|nr:hypothetical protein [Desulfobulbaceae bacterium]MDY0349940.1 hypothetical protein [Desulfobulbaceae bacterium]